MSLMILIVRFKKDTNLSGVQAPMQNHLRFGRCIGFLEIFPTVFLNGLSVSKYLIHLAKIFIREDGMLGFV